MFIGFVLMILMMVYFYLPYHLRNKPGTHYLNPRINMEVVRPNMAFHPSDEKAKDSVKPDMDSLDLRQIPDYITERSKCPACFGEDLCPDVDSGAIKIVVPEDEGDVLKVKGVYNGYWKGQPVVIKRLNKPEEYAKVDAFLCQNASLPENCDVAQAIVSPGGLVQSERAFDPDFLRQAWKIMHSRPDKLPVVACITEDVIKFLSEEYDSNKDQVLSAEEKAKFFMSLVFNPETLFLEFAKKEGLKIHFPEILGRCGRIVVTEHAGVPLSSYLEKPFKERADIAMMLLGMIFFLQNFSTRWSLVFSDFNFDNFYIKDYSLYIVDAEDMLVSDTKKYPEPRERDKSICNHECMEKFALRLFDYDHVSRDSVCPLVSGVTEQAMYALACERILSYLPEHRHYSPFKGLLHDPPVEAAPFLETGLRECVRETSSEGRISSIDVLSEMLERYTDYGNYQYNENDEDHDWENEGGPQGGPQEGQQGGPQGGPQEGEALQQGGDVQPANQQNPLEQNVVPQQDIQQEQNIQQPQQNIQQNIQQPQLNIEQSQQNIQQDQNIQQPQQNIEQSQQNIQQDQNIQQPQLNMEQSQQNIQQDQQNIEQLQQNIQQPQQNIEQLQQNIQQPQQNIQQPQQNMEQMQQNIQQPQQNIQQPQIIQQQPNIEQLQPNIQQPQQNIQQPQQNILQPQQNIQQPQIMQQQQNMEPSNKISPQVVQQNIQPQQMQQNVQPQQNI